MRKSSAVFGVRWVFGGLHYEHFSHVLCTLQVTYATHTHTHTHIHTHTHTHPYIIVPLRTVSIRKTRR